MIISNGWFLDYPIHYYIDYSKDIHVSEATSWFKHQIKINTNWVYYINASKGYPGILESCKIHDIELLNNSFKLLGFTHSNCTMPYLGRN